MRKNEKWWVKGTWYLPLKKKEKKNKRVPNEAPPVTLFRCFFRTLHGFQFSALREKGQPSTPRRNGENWKQEGRARRKGQPPSWGTRARVKTQPRERRSRHREGSANRREGENPHQKDRTNSHRSFQPQPWQGWGHPPHEKDGQGPTRERDFLGECVARDSTVDRHQCQ